MDMLKGEQIAEAALTDWRKLAQGLHARYLVPDFAAAARLVTAIAEAGDAAGHHPRVRIGDGHVDLELVTTDAVYRDEDDGSELVVEWVTQQDVDLARVIERLAAEQDLRADPTAVSEVELGLDVASGAVAPVWAALLTGDPGAQGRGTPGDEIRDATVRVPNLWFGDLDEGGTPAQRVHVEVYVAPEVVQARVDAAVAAGGMVVDDSQSPGLTVVADQEGNRGVVVADTSAARLG